MHQRLLRRKKKAIKVSHLARFRVPEKVGPVGVRLHLAEDEELSQTKIDDAPSYLCCVILC